MTFATKIERAKKTTLVVFVLAIGGVLTYAATFASNISSLRELALRAIGSPVPPEITILEARGLFTYRISETFNVKAEVEAVVAKRGDGPVADCTVELLFPFQLAIEGTISKGEASFPSQQAQVRLELQFLVSATLYEDRSDEARLRIVCKNVVSPSVPVKLYAIKKP